VETPDPVTSEPRQARARHAPAGASPTRPISLVGAVVALVALEVLAWFLLRSQGWTITGDSPGYLAAAHALAHLSLNPGTQSARALLGPHGYVFAQGLGVPLLLAPFDLIGGQPLAFLGFFTILAIGFVILHQRASGLAQLERRGQLLLALAMVCPAVILASTQIYPDVLAGVFLACALIELARIELTKQTSRFSLVIIAIALATVPWFQIKNAGPAVVVLLVLVLLTFREQASRVPVAIVTAIAAASFVVLLAYNQYYFGHLLGLPQPNPAVHKTEIEHLLALVFDRDQGFLVQVPTTVFGLIGLWVSRRSLRLSSASAVVCAALLLIINGTQPSVAALGGTSLAGRFEWTVVPIVLVWSAFAFKKLEGSALTVSVVASVIAFLWIVEGGLVAIGHHVLVNSSIPGFAPFDPTLYPGWWGWLNHYLPSFLVGHWEWDLLGEIFVFAAVAVAVSSGLLGAALPQAKAHRRPLMALVAGLVALGVLVPAFGGTRILPPGPITWTQGDLQGPWSTTASTAYTPLPLTPIGAGTYAIDVTYRLATASASSAQATVFLHAPEPLIVTGWFTPFHFTDTSQLQVSGPSFTAAEQQRALSLALPATGDVVGTAAIRSVSSSFKILSAETFSFGLTLKGASQLQIQSVQLTKTGGT